ncbi:PIG-L family deacetylase [Nannocystis radixulma]|uniref:PIG-L family deacetylase n=1 Tax=Nannocystis radixulma TaxID=2995305 RepID=A0ABT5B5R0_9BACT|nr:PIG-L family deacetylase [Nannocystis radixulma]MDC0669469.1 PIG-L family deacetylase [Nannocystis radixulma]
MTNTPPMTLETMPSLPDALVEGAALVVAHPDDEVLWFGSIAARAQSLIVCFEDSGNAAHTARGRRRVSEAFPRPARWLRLNEPRTWRRTSWNDPTYTPHGLQATDPQTDQRVAETFAQLVEILERELAGATAVFTHNPWGEYGHADHALVHAAVRTVATARELPLLCPLIASLTSVRALRRQQAAWGSPMRADVDIEFCERVRSLYVTHGVWTWDEQWNFWTRDVFAPVQVGSGTVPASAIRWVRGFLDREYPEHVEDRAVLDSSQA